MLVIDLPLTDEQKARYRSWHQAGGGTRLGKPPARVEVTLNLGPGREAVRLARDLTARAIGQGLVQYADISERKILARMIRVALITLKGEAHGVATVVLAAHNAVLHRQDIESLEGK